MTWNDVLGVPATLTDPNGVVTQASYDALGRIISLAHAGAPAHQVFVYDWRAPRPLSYSYQFDGAPESLTAFSGSWAPGTGWRQQVEATNGAGEVMFKASRLDGSQWIVSEFKQRDGRGRVVSIADAFTAASLDGLTGAPAATPLQRRDYDALDRV